MFRYKNGWIINEKGKAVDVSGGRDSQNQQVIAWNKHGGLNQQWNIVYADQMKPEPTKGQMGTMGFYVERPFYIVSELKKHRYIDLISANMVIKTPNGSDSQKWFFDQKTKTVKNLKESSKSLDIQNSGRSTNLQVWKTNSQW